MSTHVPTYMRRRPIDEAGLTLMRDFIRTRFPEWVPSPIKEVLWLKRLGNHFGARVILFDDVPCLLIVGDEEGDLDEDRWVYRGLPPSLDTRGFFFHRMRHAWMRSDGSRDDALERHRWNFV